MSMEKIVIEIDTEDDSHRQLHVSEGLTLLDVCAELSMANAKFTSELKRKQQIMAEEAVKELKKDQNRIVVPGSGRVVPMRARPGGNGRIRRK